MDTDTTLDKANQRKTAASIVSLSNELIAQIARNLGTFDKYNLAQTCRTLSPAVILALYQEEADHDNHALWWASATGTLNTFKYILELNPALVNHRFQQSHTLSPHTSEGVGWSRGLSPLSVSITCGHYHIAKYLLRLGADANLPDEHRIPGNTRLWSPINHAVCLATSPRQLNRLLYLLRRFHADVNTAPCKDGEASDNGYQLRPPIGGIHDYVDALRGVNNVGNFPYSSRDRAPLLYMMSFSPPQYTQEQSFNIAVNDFYDDYRKLLYDRSVMANIMLRHGASVTLPDDETRLPPLFHLALSLVDFQASLPFCEGFAPKRSIETQYKTVISPYAIRYFSILKKHGACFNTRFGGTSLLHIVCTRSERYEDVIDYLVNSGMDANVEDDHGRTPLFEFAAFPPSSTRVWARFVQSGARVDHADHNGSTLLHHICTKFTRSQVLLLETIQMLIRLGADAGAKDNSGRTAADICDSRRVKPDQEIIDCLRECEQRGKSHHGKRSKRHDKSQADRGRDASIQSSTHSGQNGSRDSSNSGSNRRGDSVSTNGEEKRGRNRGRRQDHGRDWNRGMIWGL
ncbi:ankyrin repeat-containing domain protein [Durotheca rogersii]|uniref:ankyrin repeat-containing domain protein n=1 Tax=Durotheca rogersii TaxID=419775 RepID=UPI00221F31A3|nr:ankyrin repeat-containing domain protein [Durotheca rogersii]KAI5864955.1 ankyrin repeat-containing domain protein [Durotheca rogersii]